MNEADKRGVLAYDELHDTLGRFAGEPGVRAIRALLDLHGFRVSDSVLEVRFRQLAAATGLPPTLTKERVNEFEVDFFWADLGLVVETDGLRYHRTPASQARDRRRDQAHTAAGLTTLRFTHHQITHEPDYVKTILIKTVRQIRGAARFVLPREG